MSGNQRFSITPSAAAEDTSLPDSVYRTLACLGVFGDKNGWCWPSLETLANMRGVSKPRISQDIKILVERGYVQKQAQFKNHEQQTNKYRLLFDADGLTTGVNGGLTTTVNGGLTPAVNGGLTTGVNQNAPFNAPINDNNNDNQKIQSFAEYQNNIALLTPMSQSELSDMVDTYTDEWVVDAIKIAVSKNARNLRYISAVLRSWKEKGKDWKPQKPKYFSQPSANERVPAGV